MKASISYSCLSFSSSDFDLSLFDSPSAAICFVLKTYFISKSNKRIHANHFVTRAPDKSVPNRFSCAAKTLASTSSTKSTLYTYALRRFSAFRTPRYSRLVASYRYFILFHIPLSQREDIFLFFIIYIRTAFYLFSLKSTVRIISPALSE